LNCIRYVRPGGGLVPAFNLTEAVDVNGPNEHKAYSLLKNACPSPTTVFGLKNQLMFEYYKPTDIKWNFEKILLGRDGQPYLRYSSATDPADLEEDIEKLLSASENCKR